MGHRRSCAVNDSRALCPNALWLSDVDVVPRRHCLEPGSQCGVRRLRKGDLEALLAVAAVDPPGRRNQDLGPFGGCEELTGPDVEHRALPLSCRTQGQTPERE